MLLYLATSWSHNPQVDLLGFGGGVVWSLGRFVLKIRSVQRKLPIWEQMQVPKKQSQRVNETQKLRSSPKWRATIMFRSFFTRSPTAQDLLAKSEKRKSLPLLKYRRSRSDGAIAKPEVRDLLPWQQTAEQPYLTDQLWDKIFCNLDESALFAVSLCSRRFNTLAKTPMSNLGCPDPVKSRKGVETICALLSKDVHFARNLIQTMEPCSFSDHPFWTTRMSRLRLLLCGAFEKDSGYSGVAELRLLHGRQHYYAILLDPLGQVLFCDNHFGRRCIQQVIHYFCKISKGDYVSVFKPLSPPNWHKHVAGLSERIKACKATCRSPEYVRRQDDQSSDGTLSIDRDASIEFGYLRQRVGMVPRIKI